jgi:hypothetical protein
MWYDTRVNYRVNVLEIVGAEVRGAFRVSSGRLRACFGNRALGRKSLNSLSCRVYWLARVR